LLNERYGSFHKNISTNIPHLSQTAGGELTIDNSSGEDPVVKVISVDDGRLTRQVFVQRGTKIYLSHLHEGQYKILFAVGKDWDGERHRFMQDQAFYEFGENLTFNET
jgi:hypothetical protein